MQTHDTHKIDLLLEKMWQDYIGLNPQAKKIHDLFSDLGERVLNDHIALRTFALPKVCVEVLSRPFIAAGYVEKGAYHFEEKKLFAKHFEFPNGSRPKIFISELQVNKLDVVARELINALVDQIPSELVRRDDFCCLGRPWEVSFQTYSRLKETSEYAAWLAAIGYRPNHFTVAVESHSQFKSLNEVNAFLERSGFELNASGGKIKGSADQLLEQSSVIANTIDVSFADGSHRVPGCYYEFAKRYCMASGGLYQGFIAASADKIFESTDRGQ
jgi:hypothetical protein